MKIVMLKKTILATLIPLLIIGCADVSRKRYSDKRLLVKLDSAPEGARVFLDGRKRGYTPFALELTYLSDSGGNHWDETRERIIKIEKDGYEPYVLSFSIKGKEYEKVPGIILLKKLSDVVKKTGSRSKEQQHNQELKEIRRKYKKALKEIEGLKKEIALLKGKRNTQKIKRNKVAMEDLNETEWYERGLA